MINTKPPLVIKKNGYKYFLVEVERPVGYEVPSFMGHKNMVLQRIEKICDSNAIKRNKKV